MICLPKRLLLRCLLKSNVRNKIENAVIRELFFLKKEKKRNGGNKIYVKIRAAVMEKTD